MTFIQKAITALKDYLLAFVARDNRPDRIYPWMEPYEFDACMSEPKKPVRITPAAMVNIRLAQIAIEQAAIIADIDNRKARKVAWLKPLKALRHEQMALETGRLVWKDGAWVQKEKA